MTAELTPKRPEIVKELHDFKGQACLVKRGEEHFVVSSVDAYSGPETLVFPATADGKVTEWGEVAGGRGMSREEAIAELADSYGSGSGSQIT